MVILTLCCCFFFESNHHFELFIANAQNTFRILDKNLGDDMIGKFKIESFFQYIRYWYLDLLKTTPANETDELQCVMNARSLYSSCVDEEKIEAEGNDPVLSLITTEFGGWPILEGSSWNESTFNLSNLLLKLRQYNYNIIFRINTDVDEENSTLPDIEVNQIDYQSYRITSVVLGWSRHSWITTTSIL